jgi:hypothetical protein
MSALKLHCSGFNPLQYMLT